MTAIILRREKWLWGLGVCMKTVNDMKLIRVILTLINYREIEMANDVSVMNISLSSRGAIKVNRNNHADKYSHVAFLLSHKSRNLSIEIKLFRDGKINLINTYIFRIMHAISII